MIIDTPMKLNDIITLKLVNGDELIGKLIDEYTDTYIEISKPHVVAMAQQGFGLIPYALTMNVDTSIKIEKQHVIAYAKTADPVAKQFIKQTTGLFT